MDADKLMLRKEGVVARIVLQQSGAAQRDLNGTAGRLKHSRREPVLSDQREDFGGGCGDVGAGAVDCADPGFFEESVVLGWDYAAADDEDIGRTFALQRFDQGGD